MDGADSRDSACKGAPKKKSVGQSDVPTTADWKMERTKDRGKTRLDNEPHQIPDIRHVVAVCYQRHENWSH